MIKGKQSLLKPNPESVHLYQLAVKRNLSAWAKNSYLTSRGWNAHRRALPDFLILGAQKSGTTSLFNYLCQHPRVIGSIPKEIFYLCSHLERGDLWYRRHFPLKKSLRRRGQITGEATPTTLYSAQAAEYAAKLVPNAKLIVTLREPAARAVSHYHHQVRFGRETRSINEVFSLENIRRYEKGDNPDLPWRNYFTWSNYEVALRPWQALFPVEQLLILHAEHLFANAQAVLNTTYKFLDLDPFTCPNLQAFNVGGQSHEVPEIFFCSKKLSNISHTFIIAHTKQSIAFFEATFKIL